MLHGGGNRTQIFFDNLIGRHSCYGLKDYADWFACMQTAGSLIGRNKKEAQILGNFCGTWLLVPIKGLHRLTGFAGQDQLEFY